MNFPCVVFRAEDVSSVNLGMLFSHKLIGSGIKTYYSKQRLNHSLLNRNPSISESEILFQHQ